MHIGRLVCLQFDVTRFGPAIAITSADWGWVHVVQWESDLINLRFDIVLDMSRT